MNNVQIKDNGAAFLVTVNGTITSAHSSLGDAWRHIEWMYKVAQQQFTVGPQQTPVKAWLDISYKNGFLEKTGLEVE